ncbi:MAG: hypothetical protein ACREA0_31440, partial [bacterium]
QWLPPDARVKDLESVDWRQLRGLWDGSPADWNHMARAVSGFLTRLLGDIYHPERRAIVKRIPREKETKRRPSFPGNLFWQIVDKTPEHARPCYVILGATGMRTGEFLAAEAEGLHPEICAIDTTGKTGPKRYLIAPDFWPWVEVGIPSPLRYGWMRRYYKRAVEALGYPDLRLHDLRHLFAQIAKQEGIPTADTQSALGQATPGITRDYEMEDVKGAVAKAVGRGLRRRNKGQSPAGSAPNGRGNFRGSGLGKPRDSTGKGVRSGVIARSTTRGRDGRRPPPRRTENPRVGGSIPSLATRRNSPFLQVLTSKRPPSCGWPFLLVVPERRKLFRRGVTVEE